MPTFMIYNGLRNELDLRTFPTIEKAQAAFIEDVESPDCTCCSGRIHCLVEHECERVDGYIWELPDLIELKVSPLWFGGMSIVNEVFDKIPGSWTWHWTPEGFKPARGRDEHVAS